MRRILGLAVLLMVPVVVCAEGKPLPRGFEDMGIAAPLSLDMTAGDLDRIKGKVTKSSKFVSVVMDNGYLVTITLNDKADRLVKIIAQLQKNQYTELLKKMQSFSEGNQYEKEKEGSREIHTWKDAKTVIRLVSTGDFSRIDLMNLKELEE